jgi:hypothetical protein
MNAGRVSHPRTMEADDMRALSWSISHSGKRLRTLLERDLALEACQCGTEAVVDPVAEGEMLDGLAKDVEAIAVGESPVVAVGGGDEEDQHAALRYGRPV